MKITEHFSLAEFERSQAASRAGISNRVPTELLPNARRTLEMMQRIRDYLSTLAGRDVPIHLTSGYRCLVVNRMIGSRDTSDHVQALSCDWEAPSFGEPDVIAAVLAPQVGALGIGQLILEYPPDGWVHTSAKLPAKAVDRVITITRDGVFAGIKQ
jgi:uncharacterized protein YcbK (DUF882 family)